MRWRIPNAKAEVIGKCHVPVITGILTWQKYTAMDSVDSWGRCFIWDVFTPGKQSIGLSLKLPKRRHMSRHILHLSVAQLCLTLCDPMDHSPPGSSGHGIFQARILEWVAIPSSRRWSRPRDRTHISCIGGRFSATWATKEALFMPKVPPKMNETVSSYEEFKFSMLTVWKYFK